MQGAGPWQGLNVSWMEARSNHGGIPHAVLEKACFLRCAAGGPGDGSRVRAHQRRRNLGVFYVAGEYSRRGWTCRRAKRGCRCCQRVGLPKPGEGFPAGTLRGPLVEKGKGGAGVCSRNCRGLCFRFLPVHTDVQEEGAEAGFVVLLGIRVTLSPDWEQGVGGRHGFSSEVPALPSRGLTEAGEWGGGGWAWVA